MMYSSPGKQVLHRLLHQQLHQVGRDGASAPSFGNRQMMIVPAAHSSISLQPLTLDDVVPGSFYEIDPHKIPPNYPDQIRRIRIVMVSEKTESRVSLRFSSTYSLSCHFSRFSAPHTHSIRMGKSNLPPLDEKYVIGSETACQMLLRRVSREELTERKMALDFWVAESTSTPIAKTNDVNRGGDVSGTSLLGSKKGSCWSELWGTDMVSWGKRRRVRFLNRHEESGEDKPGQLLAFTRGCEGKNDEGEEEEEEADEEGEMAKMDDELEVKSPVRAKTKSTQKRKHFAGGKGASTSTKKRLRGHLIRNRGEQVKVCARSNWSKAKERGTINRWSTERYKLAEVNMLKIMKEKGAVFNNPITRPALRTEARKLIGDTGLLDHLLKHMSGKPAPGGEERFRRRHNSEGAMEYWLESADLVDVRRQAGVDDPFWTPPCGWKLGDDPSQDPTCAREIRELRKEVSILKRDIDQLTMAVFERQGGELAGATTRSSSDSEQVVASMISLKEMCNELSRKDAAREEQLREMSLSLTKTKAAMEELVVEMALSLDGIKEEMSKPGQSMLLQPMAISNNGAKEVRPKDHGTPTMNAAAAAPETMLEMMRVQKAEKLQRLGNGLEICKPHFPFQWSVPTSAPDHLLSFPTAPSMSSASPLSQPSPPQPGSPFKPISSGRHASTVLRSSSPVGINLNDDPTTHL